MPCLMELSHDNKNVRNTGLQSAATSRSSVLIKLDVDEEVDEQEVYAAMVSAEKNFLMDDEEISSFDSNGNPVADTAKLEDHMMSVAMARSVAETISPVSLVNDKRSYSSRSRRNVSSNITTCVNTNARPQSGIITKRIPPPTTTLVTPSPLPAPVSSNAQVLQKARYSGTSSSSSSMPPMLTQRIVTTSQHGVPNPLANIGTPMKHDRSLTLSSAVDITASKKPNTIFSGITVPCPLPKVRLPHPYTELNLSTKAEPVIPTTANTYTELPLKRGRIFSMDIDREYCCLDDHGSYLEFDSPLPPALSMMIAAGLDFPDMTVETIYNDFGVSQVLPPLGSSTVHKSVHTAPPQPAPLPAVKSSSMIGGTISNVSDLPHPANVTSNTAVNIYGRSRAMSFEFFSLGINADEPLPPANMEPTLTSEQVIIQRPRGDSIIFDPVSFQDGGIHEEKAGNMFHKDVDLPLGDATEMAILNTPGLFATVNKGITTNVSSTITANTLSYSATSEVAAMKAPVSTTITASLSSAAAAAAAAASATTNTITTTTTTSTNSLSNSLTNMELLNKDGRIGIYLPEQRRARIAKFHSKRKMRIWKKRIKYDCRKKLADSRPRIKGRFVKRTEINTTTTVTV